MSSSTYVLSFPGVMTQPGFWLYVCKIIPHEDKLLLYVGMTGDPPPKGKDKKPNRPNSPFGRITASLGGNSRSSAIKNHLQKVGLAPDQCRSFEFVAYGPVFPETDDKEKYAAWRWEVAALERALTDALKAAGYSVLNQAENKRRYDPELWHKAKEAFGCHFAELIGEEG